MERMKGPQSHYWQVHSIRWQHQKKEGPSCWIFISFLSIDFYIISGTVCVWFIEKFIEIFSWNVASCLYAFWMCVAFLKILFNWEFFKFFFPPPTNSLSSIGLLLWDSSYSWKRKEKLLFFSSCTMNNFSVISMFHLLGMDTPLSYEVWNL